MGEYTNMAQGMIRTIAGAAYMSRRMEQAQEANDIALDDYTRQLPDFEEIQAGNNGGPAAGEMVGEMASKDVRKMQKADAALTRTNAFPMVDRLKRYSGMRTAQRANRESVRGGKPISDVPAYDQFGGSMRIFGQGGKPNGQE
jgi:hypothetical protein